MGRPLLAWWLDLFERHNIDEVLINLHYLPHTVEEFVRSYKSKVKVNLFYEKELLGSAGTLLRNKDFVKDEKFFYIMYADNLTNIDLIKFLKDFENSRQNFGMVLFRSANPESCGIVELDQNNIIIDFEEKPQKPKSNLANGGIYIARPRVLELIPTKSPTDIGFDLLPKLINKMYGYETNDFLIDIGSYKNLEIAEKCWGNFQI